MPYFKVLYACGPAAWLRHSTQSSVSPAESAGMRATQRPCALLLALLCLCSAPWRFLRQYVHAYDPCVYPGAHLEAMFRCAMKSMPDDVKAEVEAILNRIPGLQLREVVDLMCKANRQSGIVMVRKSAKSRCTCGAKLAENNLVHYAGL
nr:uncharacterized protein LOC126537179 [Dermacentor andersoni]